MISDPVWQQYLAMSKTVESGQYGNYKMLLLASDEAIGIFTYPFRMFFFNGDEAVLALNLEVGALGTCSLGVHDSEAHRNFGSGNPEMPMDEFKLWALETASKFLDLTSKS
jgi:hypothetical protein